MEDLAPAPGKMDDHAAAALGCCDGLGILAAGEHRGDVFAILDAEEAAAGQYGRALLDGGGKPERQDFETLRRQRRVGHMGQAATDFIGKPVHLISEDPGCTAEDVTIIEPGPGEGPVLRAIDRKSLGAARAAAGPAGIEPVRGVEAEACRTGTADFRRFP